MKKSFLTLSLFTLMLTAKGYSQSRNVEVFDEMINYLNQTANTGQYEVNAFDIIVTNNTIRTNGRGTVYQYAAFGEGKVTFGCIRDNQMTFNLTTRFSDRNKFNGATDSETNVIFKENNQVKLKVTSHTWGGTNVTSVGIELFKTGLGGYCMRIKGTDSFSTITFTRSKDICIP